MKELLPILRLFKAQSFFLCLSILLAFSTLAAAIGLLSLSGWFITATATVGVFPLIAQNFNYMLPAGGVRGFSIIRTFCRWAERVISHDATFRILEDLRVYFFQKLAPHFTYFNRHFSYGDLLNRLVSDIDVMDQLFLRLINPLIVGIMLIFSITLFTCYFDVTIGLVLGGALLLFLLSLPVIFFRLGKEPSQNLAILQMQYRQNLVDWFDNHSELLLFGQEQRFNEKLRQSERELYVAQAKLNQISAGSNLLLIILTGWTFVLILWLSAAGIGNHSPDPLIALVAFTTLASFELLAPIANAFQYLGQTLLSAQRLNEITQRKADITFPKSSDTISEGNIEFDQIRFNYPDATAQEPVFSDFSLKIKAKQKIAIVGKTGKGKSTLFKLLVRDFNPTQGHIYIDGQSIDRYSEKALFNGITLVEQEIDIFSDTLKNNLLLANPTTTDDTLKKVLMKVELDYLLETKEGLGLWLGKRGRDLSGGEKRRIGIARALLHPSPILLLDEPTESLDKDLEQQMMTHLMDYAQDKTLIYITHRHIGLDKMDKIYTM